MNAVRTVVTGSATVKTLLGFNVHRVSAVITNNSTSNLFIALGDAAQSGTTDFTYKLATNTSVTLPTGYTGQVQGVQDAANGNYQITEIQ